jgi:phosphopantothenoylcysteine decarboxylase / phosphopantothenate---cysteine ligase
MPLTRRIILGVTGSIAAYKAAELARCLVQEGAEVTAVMTANAGRFITPLTLRTLTGRPVATELFADPNSAVPHVTLAQWAEAILIAPATADAMARATQGRADDLLSALLLDSRSPVIWAPAMNTRMWEHPLTQENVKRLLSLGHYFVTPGEGGLACGESGRGRLAGLPEILAVLKTALGVSSKWQQRRVLITAGPTREPIDAVRYLSNRSTGRMGYALAAAASRRGAQVTLISGPVALTPPPGVACIQVVTAQEMHTHALAAFAQAEVVIAAAAVSDFRPAQPADEKIKKDRASLSLPLELNPDILADLGKIKKNQILVGFAAETQADLIAAGTAKLKAKHLDLIVANRASGPEDAFAAETSSAVLIDAQGQTLDLPRQPKTDLAEAILNRIEPLLS